MGIDLEICIEKQETALVADRLGVKRVELCSALDLGGLTPSVGLIEACSESCSLDVFAMIRPRGGGFVYTTDELKIMERDIINAKKAGAKGVVFGCLTGDFLLDDYQNQKLLAVAKSLDLGVTFHRAFDRCQSPEKGLNRLIDWGFDRVLNSGQAATAPEGIEKIKSWVKQSEGQIEIMAGSGVNASNAQLLAEAGVDALHFTARKKVQKEDLWGMGGEYETDREKIERVLSIFKKNWMWTFLILLIFTLFSCQEREQCLAEIPLKDGWSFQYKDHWYPAQVPGDIHTDLFRNGLIPDPFWENNEDSLQWIEKENWEYRSSFVVKKELLNRQHIEMVFDGLDTYADISINGRHLLSANNMFRAWRKEIKPWLREGENTIKISFRSPILENWDRVKNYPYHLPSGNETVEVKVSSFTRKAAYQFGWDWGPRFVGCGIWRPVHLEAWDEAKMTDVYVYTKSLNSDEALLSVEVEVEIDNKREENYSVQVNETSKNFLLTKGTHHLQLDYRIAQPQLWWTNGLGKPYLYHLDIKLLKNGEILDKNQQKTGIRTIELVNEPDSIGTSFYFKINGEPVFMKGANYIPQDIFTGNFSKEKNKRLIQKVKSSHMNMLRIWGGGIYENDDFYDLCDENGILVWQDFMFAGSLYPDDEEFLENVKAEVDYNIRRLRNHASLALWCGNNEIEVAWNNWGWQKQYGYTWEDSIAIWENYLNIFQKMIPNQIEELDKTRAYVSTSPLSNWGTPENFNHSSMHYWGVWHGREPFVNYKTNVGRFMVEYGFQSFPGMEVIKTFAADSSLYLESAVMKNRQKSYIGNGLIEKHLKRWYEKPRSFADFVDKNQQLQAEALKMAIKSHRRQKPHCMGTLFWQLNDCWTGPSWSVLDYQGNEKPAMAVVREYFKPVIAVAEEINDSLAVFVVSDLPEAVRGELRLQLQNRENKTIWRFEESYQVGKNGVRLVVKKELKDILKGEKRSDVNLKVELQRGEEVLFSDVIRFTPQF